MQKDEKIGEDNDMISGKNSKGKAAGAKDVQMMPGRSSGTAADSPGRASAATAKDVQMPGRADREMAERQTDMAEQNLGMSGEISSSLKTGVQQDKSFFFKGQNTQIRVGNQIVNAINKLRLQMLMSNLKKKSGDTNIDLDRDRKKKGRKGKDSDRGRDVDVDFDRDRGRDKHRDRDKNRKDRDFDFDGPDFDRKKPPPLPDTAKPKTSKLGKIKNAFKGGAGVKGLLGGAAALTAALFADELFGAATDAIADSDLGDAVKEKVAGSIDSVSDMASTASTALGALSIGNMVTGGAVTAGLSGGLGFGALGATALGGLGTMGAGAMAGAGIMTAGAGAAGYGVGKLADAGITALLGKSLGDAVYDGIHDEFGNLKIGKVIPIAEIQKGMSKTATFLTDSVQSAYNATGEAIKSGAVYAGEKFNEGITAASGMLTTAISDGIAGTSEFLTGTLESMKTGILGMVTSAGDWMSDTIGGTFRAAKDFLKELVISGAGIDVKGGGGKSGGAGASGEWTEDQKPGSTPGNGGKTVKDMSGHTLGELSEKYESGGKGPGVVSTGKGDRGGVSYGTYQFASKTGSADAYVKNSKYAAEFKGLKAGTSEFSAKWKEIAARDPEGFRADQHEAIKKTHYDPFVKGVQAKTGLDINQRSKAVQDVAWSTSVQHGGGASHIFATAMKGKDPATMSDADIINAVYAERGRRDASGNLAHFSKNAKGVQEGVANRFVNERKNALAMLAGEQHQGKNVSEAEGKPVNLDTNLRVKGGMNGQAFAGGKTHEGTIALAQAIQGELGDSLTRFTAFNDKYHQGRKSKHNQGTALDFTIKDASQSAAVSERIRQMGAKMGIGLYVKDEYKNPSGHATGGHIHVNFTSPEEAKKFLSAVKKGVPQSAAPVKPVTPVSPVKTADAIAMPAVKPVPAPLKTAEIPQKQVPDVGVLTPEEAAPVTGRGSATDAAVPAGTPAGSPGQPQKGGGTTDQVLKALAKIEQNTRNTGKKNDPSAERDSNIPTRTGDDYVDRMLHDDI